MAKTLAKAILGTRRWNEVIRPMCRNRDALANAPCWICGQPIDYTITDGPEAWSPDHYRPRRANPELGLDPDNIRPAHRRCNVANRPPEHVASHIVERENWWTQ